MSEQKINMHFDVDGKCKIEAEGFEGGTCLDATKPFEDLFSSEVSERKMEGECIAPDQGERVL